MPRINRDEPEDDWLRAYRFSNPSSAKAAYCKASYHVLRNDTDISLYRLHHAGSEHVVILGNRPPPPALVKFSMSFATGQLVTLPAPLTEELLERRRERLFSAPVA